MVPSGGICGEIVVMFRFAPANLRFVGNSDITPSLAGNVQFPVIRKVQ
jgi:hypothetical protein